MAPNARHGAEHAVHSIVPDGAKRRATGHFSQCWADVAPEAHHMAPDVRHGVSMLYTACKVCPTRQVQDAAEGRGGRSLPPILRHPGGVSQDRAVRRRTGHFSQGCALLLAAARPWRHRRAT
jgi:hypothetical protein